MQLRVLLKIIERIFFLEILNINQLNPSQYAKYGFDEKSILPSISTSSEIIYKNIVKEISKLKNPYKDFVLNIYSHYEDKIKNYPDLLTYSNYGQRGSLILKIYNALRIAKLIYSNKTLKDKDVIISAILLKYIGRVKQYKYDIIFSFSDVSKSENCFILSRDIIKKHFKKDKSLTKEHIIELTDIILFDSDTNDSDNYKAMIVSNIYNLEKSISHNQQNNE